MAIATQNWPEARRHGARAVELAPDAPGIEAIALNLAYAEAVEAEDEAARQEVVERIAQLLEEDPDNRLLRR
jgi:hypothetical protein